MSETIARAGQKMRRQENGYRYVRQYRTQAGDRWACWERQDGKLRRVGTAWNVHEMERYLAGVMGFCQTCRHCGCYITYDRDATWVDETGGDGCDPDVHHP